MDLRIWSIPLKLRNPWTIATDLAGDDESCAGVREFLKRVDPGRLSFEDVGGSMAYLESLSAGEAAAKAAVNIALLDGASRMAGDSLSRFLGLGFEEGRHVTSFSIGIDSPGNIERKVREAETFPILKLKLGSPSDRENFQALRNAAPGKPVRVDGNEAWETKEKALENIEWLAEDGNVQFVEQPMHADAPNGDLAWLKERSPLPLMGDESYHTRADLARCLERYHAVNVKLVKAGGVTGARQALEAARDAGLTTMIGCMIESSVLISAAAHLAELADHLDIDGNLLISDDPYEGVVSEGGVLSFAAARERTGLQVRERNGS
jgi:L-alanine-DL-glutamate epimerase-like enolase superfamily enzyme